MSEAELIFTALTELSTRQIAETGNARGIEENKKASIKADVLQRKLDQSWSWKQANQLSQERIL